jgi:methylated-DNA-[protein]-cysteine S-methyltransferase
MNKITIKYYKSPVGEIVLGSFQDKLCLADWRYRKMRSRIDNRIKKYFNADYFKGESEILSQTIFQFEEYFHQKRKTFDIPLLFAGTDFQKKVWTELEKISFGSFSTYLQLAEKIGDKKAVRAVANANGANAIAIILPCHRIIGTNGKLVGYAGGLKAKQKLLELENNLFSLNFK